MNFWFLSPDILEMLEFEKDHKGHYRVRSCPLSKSRLAHPEEIVRQLVLAQLISHYHYPYENLVVEPPIKMGIAKKRADIGILNFRGNLEIIIEIKQVANEESVPQLHSYMHASGVKYGALITLFDRHIFYRDPSGNISTTPDLPTYLNKQIKESARIEDEKNSSFLPYNMLNELGISIKRRLSLKRSEIEIQGEKLVVSNIDLLDFSKLRKIAIGVGVVLPSTISKSNWNLMLQQLFENVPAVNCQIDGDNSQDEQQSFQVFLREKSLVTDERVSLLFRDFYETFSNWYIKEFSGAKTFLPSKRSVSGQLRKSGFQLRKLGGQMYIHGLRLN